ncbi:MAG: choice-of-anchor D domain-containing protein, partial [Candidatus Acidiferrales bacterium]
MDPSKGPVEAYNNLIVHAGMGPDPSDGPAVYAGIYFAQILNAGSACSSNCGAPVYNNTLYNNGSGGSPLNGQAAVSANPGPVAPQVRNNLIYQMASQPYLDISSPLVCETNLFFGVGAAPAVCSHSTNADPLFVANFTDFHLQALSPAAGAATAGASAFDLDGYVRANPASLGAYEYQSGLIFPLRMNPQGLSFGNTLIGSASPSQTVSVINTTTNTVNFATITVIGDFSETDTCAPSLAPGSICAFTIIFSPTGAGQRTGAISLVDDSATGGTQGINLVGIGVSPAVTPSPSSLSFGSQNVGTTSAAQSISVPNTGASPLGIGSVVVTGDFAQTNDCGQSVAGNGECTISVTFTPKASGSRTGTVTITDSAVNSPQLVTLTGAGIVATASLSPKSLTFSSQSLGSSSAPQNVNLSNTGTGPLTISNITVSGDYSLTNNCVSPLAAATNCVISVVFTPTA